MDNIARESPLWVKTSLAAAIGLGLEPGRFYRNAEATCLNLLLCYEKGCAASCAYCGLGRNRAAAGEKTFIRVKWPRYALEEILQKLRERPRSFRRICVSMITHPAALKDTVTIISFLRRVTDLPISVLVTPTVMRGSGGFLTLLAAGADHVGVAVDAATDTLFDALRGKGVKGPHRWERYWRAVAEAVEVFGRGRVGIHLIVGLGETEEDCVRVMDRARAMGAVTHLFSFYPEAGSLLADRPQPSVERYRRVQMARYLIDNGHARYGEMRFDDGGRILSYGVDPEPFVRSGEPFMTSGCPGRDGRVACNRPFANERAGRPFRNYPFAPEPEDIETIRSQFKPGGESRDDDEESEKKDPLRGTFGEGL